MRDKQAGAAELTDIDDARDETVSTLDVSELGPSVEVIVRAHFDPTAVHDPDLAFFALATDRLGCDTTTFLDIGANVANTIASLMALRCRFPVHAFEINPALHAHLLTAATLYTGSCVIHPFGLAEEAGRPWLYIPALKDFFVLGESTLSLAHLQEDLTKTRLRSYLPGESLRVGRLRVEVRTLDSVGLSPDFVKIDVEGTEDSVVTGGLETLRRSRPIIMAENSYPERVDAALAPLGYRWYCFDATQGKLQCETRPSQNTFYIGETWAARLSQVGLIN